MFKKSLIAAALAFAAVCVKADFLYWQVSDPEGYSEATLYAAKAGQENTVVKFVSPRDFNETTLTGTETGTFQTDVTAFKNAEYSFFVEMVTYANSSGDILSTKKGYTWSYDELVSNGYISAGGISVPSFAAVGPINMGSPAPEPTSGLLILVGGAMLALRRRRRD